MAMSTASSTMPMPGSATVVATASTTSAMSMGGMGMGGGMGGGNSCKISVGNVRPDMPLIAKSSRCYGTGTPLTPVSDTHGNFDSVYKTKRNLGFISSEWQVTSPGMFGGSCIGVIFLVMSLAFLRRLHRSYDTTIARSLAVRQVSQRESKSTHDNDSKATVDTANTSTHRPLLPFGFGRNPLRPTVLQQTLRALLHMVEFAVAYFVMLLAMYFNGYIIICILIGAFLGYFVFEWDSFQK